jgi:hypothetical protein
MLLDPSDWAVANRIDEVLEALPPGVASHARPRHACDRAQGPTLTRASRGAADELARHASFGTRSEVAVSSWHRCTRTSATTAPTRDAGVHNILGELPKDCPPIAAGLRLPRRARERRSARGSVPARMRRPPSTTRSEPVAPHPLRRWPTRWNAISRPRGCSASSGELVEPPSEAELAAAGRRPRDP